MLNQSINHVSLDVEVMRIKPHFRKSKLVVPCRVKLRMVEHEAGNYERRLLQTMVVSTEAAERKNGEDRPMVGACVKLLVWILDLRTL